MIFCYLHILLRAYLALGRVPGRAGRVVVVGRSGRCDCDLP